MQKSKSTVWIKENTQYGYAFYDFDGTTGFDLYHRLNRTDKEMIKKIAMNILLGKK